MAISRSRRVEANQTVNDQADLFQGNGYDRVTGVGFSSITLKIFWNNITQPWTIADGSGLTDAQITSGKVFWHEIAGSPGYYAVRFRPTATGLWRIVLTYPAGSQVNQIDYDVYVQPTAVSETGLRASFTKP